MVNKSTVNIEEVKKFSQHADVWWDTDGPLKTLHDINAMRLEYIKKYCDLKNQKILDIGCGGGILAESMAKCSADVTGLDVDEKTIAVAKSHAIKNSLNISYECVPVEDFVGGDFSIITCLEMLEHVENPDLVILNAVRLLRHGGYLFLSTINRTLKAYLSVVVAAEYVLGLLPRQTHDFNKFIKPSELAATIRSYGLNLIDITGMSYNPWLRKSSLINSLDTNYLLVCQKE